MSEQALPFHLSASTIEAVNNFDKAYIAEGRIPRSEANKATVTPGFGLEGRVDRLYRAMYKPGGPNMALDDFYVAEFNAIDAIMGHEITRQRNVNRARALFKAVPFVGTAIAASFLSWAISKGAYIDAHAYVGWFGNEIGRQERVLELLRAAQGENILARIVLAIGAAVVIHDLVKTQDVFDEQNAVTGGFWGAFHARGNDTRQNIQPGEVRPRIVLATYDRPLLPDGFSDEVQKIFGVAHGKYGVEIEDIEVEMRDPQKGAYALDKIIYWIGGGRKLRENEKNALFNILGLTRQSEGHYGYDRSTALFYNLFLLRVLAEKIKDMDGEMLDQLKGIYNTVLRNVASDIEESLIATTPLVQAMPQQRVLQQVTFAASEITYDPGLMAQEYDVLVRAASHENLLPEDFENGEAAVQNDISILIQEAGIILSEREAGILKDSLYRIDEDGGRALIYNLMVLKSISQQQESPYLAVRATELYDTILNRVIDKARKPLQTA